MKHHPPALPRDPFSRLLIPSPNLSAEREGEANVILIMTDDRATGILSVVTGTSMLKDLEFGCPSADRGSDSADFHD